MSEIPYMKCLKGMSSDCFGLIEHDGEIVCGVLRQDAKFDGECPFYCPDKVYEDKQKALYGDNGEKYEELAGVKPATGKEVRAWVRAAEFFSPLKPKGFTKKQIEAVEMCLTEGGE